MRTDKRKAAGRPTKAAFPNYSSLHSTGFDRTRLPDPRTYYEGLGLAFRERGGKWRTTRCEFHGGSDSMRINTETGAFSCMAGCGARGGDVLAYEMARTGCGFVDACKRLGAWLGGDEQGSRRPAPFSARDALQVLATEANLVAIMAMNQARGTAPTPADLERLRRAAGRIGHIAGYVL